MRGGVIPELGDTGVPLERGLDDAALNPRAASVDQADGCYSGSRGGIDVLGHHGKNIARRERMEVELVFDRNSHRVGHGTTPCAVSLWPCTRR